MNYLPVLERIDSWFDAVRSRHPGVIPCKPGCNACCHGPFDISVADVVAVRAGVGALSPAAQTRVRSNATTLLTQMLGFEPSWRAPYDVAQLGEERFDSLVEQLADAPCPLLDESGVCSIYAHRPFICRLMGLGIETPQNDVVPNSCPIQAEFPAYNALPAQPFDLEAWEREEDLALQNGSLALFGSETQRHFETTIATAILL